MKDHTFSVPCMIITDFVMEARPFFESQIKIKDSSRYLLSKIPVLQQSAVGSSLVGEFSLCAFSLYKEWFGSYCCSLKVVESNMWCPRAVIGCWGHVTQGMLAPDWSTQMCGVSAAGNTDNSKLVRHCFDASSLQLAVWQQCCNARIFRKHVIWAVLC